MKLLETLIVGLAVMILSIFVLSLILTDIAWAIALGALIGIATGFVFNRWRLYQKEQRIQEIMD